MNSLEDNRLPDSGKQQYYGNTQAQESPVNGEEEEVDDKVLHEDEEDVETEDKIDDAELDQGDETNATYDDDQIDSNDTDKDNDFEDKG